MAWILARNLWIPGWKVKADRGSCNSNWRPCHLIELYIQFPNAKSGLGRHKSVPASFMSGLWIPSWMSLENCDRVSDYVSSEGYLEAPSCFMLFCVAEARERERGKKKAAVNITCWRSFLPKWDRRARFSPFFTLFLLLFLYNTTFRFRSMFCNCMNSIVKANIFPFNFSQVAWILLRLSVIFRK